MKEYKSAAKAASSSFVEKRSEFISYIAPVTDEIQAQEFIAKVKAKHHDAKHCVYAFILKNGAIERCSDDGEPQGTAGQPTLQVLKNEALFDTVIVTARYFGGVLLGGGGLFRAYTKAAVDAVAQSGTKLYRNYCIYHAEYPYALHQSIVRALESSGSLLLSTEYGERVSIDFANADVSPQEVEKLITETTNGTVSCSKTEDRFMGV